ncbi:class I SAM-dependent methyltransferase [Sporobolomyces salmoneus]|uniref:class I SAM-dependent methyltransferase n=1 Tax=Sporobolomyces salmoneus TaxID=183962 RepID=UPI00316E47F7
MFLYLLCILFGLSLPTVFRSVHSRLTRSRNELYDRSDAITLNLKGRRVDATLWFNMGWWDSHGEEEFSEAASLLCRKVALAARLEANKRICEVGYGSGDSTLLLAKESSPKSYIGFTSLASQHDLASRRLKESDFDSSKFELRQGDAATALHSLPPSSVDVVLAVDCAYHFSPRQSFLTSAASTLTNDGRLALTDLLLPSTPLTSFDSLALRIICLLADLPFENLLTPKNYRASLVKAGFDESTIEMQDISDQVWPGFLRFIERREEEMGVALESSWKGLKMYSRVVRWYSGLGGGRKRLRFYLIYRTVTSEKAWARWERFALSDDAQLIRQERQHRNETGQQWFRETLRNDQEKALSEYHHKLVKLENLLSSDSNVTRTIPKAWLRVQMLPYYRRAMAKTYVKPPYKWLSELSDDPEGRQNSEVGYFFNSLVPKGLLLAEELQQIQAFTSIIVKGYYLETPQTSIIDQKHLDQEDHRKSLEAFLDWICRNAPQAAALTERFAENPHSDGVLLGFTASLPPSVKYDVRDYRKLLESKSLAHNRYFPRARRDVALSLT